MILKKLMMNASLLIGMILLLSVIMGTISNTLDGRTKIVMLVFAYIMIIVPISDYS